MTIIQSISRLLKGVLGHNYPRLFNVPPLSTTRWKKIPSTLNLLMLVIPRSPSLAFAER